MKTNPKILGPFVDIETAFHFGVSPTSSLWAKYCDKLVVAGRLMMHNILPSHEYGEGGHLVSTSGLQECLFI